jgi:hypothetical protein
MQSRLLLKVIFIFFDEVPKIPRAAFAGKTSIFSRKSSCSPIVILSISHPEHFVAFQYSIEESMDALADSKRKKYGVPPSAWYVMSF